MLLTPPTVMMKILQTGLNPAKISALIYHHYDPDLCGNIPNFEEIIDKKDLKILSHKYNNPFIRHYSVTAPLFCVEEMNFIYKFSSGRELKFVMIPYSHVVGNFITFDEKSGVLFTSDLFGSFAVEWDLYLELAEDCYNCTNYFKCPNNKSYCPLPDLLKFHQIMMTSEKALKHSINEIDKMPVKIIAPQHGSIITKKDDIEFLCGLLSSLKGVGIDRIVK